MCRCRARTVETREQVLKTIQRRPPWPTAAPEQSAHVFDDGAAAEFAGKAIGYLNAGSVATMLSIGHQTKSVRHDGRAATIG